MASLKDLKNRIASVKATQKITKAMQMVAAAKLRRAQAAAEAARPYSQRMAQVLANIVGGLGDEPQGAPPLLTGGDEDRVYLLVVCTAERGLCGGFNTSIARLARERARELTSQGKQIKILCVGKKGHDVLRREFADVMVPMIEFREVKNVGYAQAEEVSQRVLSMYDAGEFDRAALFYARFQSVISQVPTRLALIPPEIDAEAEPDAPAEGTAAAGGATNYEYEPDENEILADLLPRNVTVQIFRALLENAASEQGARMSAMDNATRNAGEMIDDLTLSYNRQRQAQITKELIEIISGAEAL